MRSEVLHPAGEAVRITEVERRGPAAVADGGGDVSFVLVDVTPTGWAVPYPRLLRRESALPGVAEDELPAQRNRLLHAVE